jgi:hypothetical protein
VHSPYQDASQWAWEHLRKSQARKLILLARRLEELPEIDAAFAAGEVPWTKVREIARVATRETERTWLQLARTGTSREVEEAVSRAKPGDEPHRGFQARPPKYLHSAGFARNPKGRGQKSEVRSQCQRIRRSGNPPAQRSWHPASSPLLGRGR